MHKGQRTSAAFLFLFLLTPASQYCKLGTVDECKEARVAPVNSLIGRGFDITTMKITVNDILDMDHKYPNGTCRLCKNEKENQFQAVGLNIDSWHSESTCHDIKVSSSHSSVLSVTDMQDKEITGNWKVGLQIPVAKIQGTVGVVLAGSHSKLVGFVTQQSIASNNVYFRHDISCTYYTIALKPNRRVHGRFQAWTNSLPANYTCHTKEEYFKVIKHYGTHFIHSGDLGGRARAITSVEQCSISINKLTYEHIKHCLTMHLTATGGSSSRHASGSATLDGCLRQQEQDEYKKKLISLTVHQDIEVQGGGLGTGLSAFKDTAMWLKSLAQTPHFVSKEITPIHELLPQNSAQRGNLQKAVGEYITQRAMKIKCLSKCSGSNPYNDCHCTCNLPYVNDVCCPKFKFSGDLTVWVIHGSNLWGDMMGETDAFVVVQFQGKEDRTIVWRNSNNPYWDKKMDFKNIMLLPESKKLTITVYDEDLWPKGNDLLGSCTIEVSHGNKQHRFCVLKHGLVEYHYKVTCYQALEGANCDKATTQTPTFSRTISG